MERCCRPNYSMILAEGKNTRRPTQCHSSNPLSRIIVTAVARRGAASGSSHSSLENDGFVSHEPHPWTSSVPVRCNFYSSRSGYSCSPASVILLSFVLLRSSFMRLRPLFMPPRLYIICHSYRYSCLYTLSPLLEKKSLASATYVQAQETVVRVTMPYHADGFGNRSRDQLGHLSETATADLDRP